MNNSRPKAKLSRALGIPLTRKCVKYFERRPFPPGVHGRGRRKASDYQVRLLEKQRLRHQYNISEAQMRKAYDDAHRGEGKTGETMVVLPARRAGPVDLPGPAARRARPLHRGRQEGGPAVVPVEARPGRRGPRVEPAEDAVPDRGDRRARGRPDPALPVDRPRGAPHDGDP